MYWGRLAHVSLPNESLLKMPHIAIASGTFRAMSCRRQPKLGDVMPDHNYVRQTTLTHGTATKCLYNKIVTNYCNGVIGHPE